MPYDNGLPYITKMLMKGALKHHACGDFKQHRRATFWINVEWSLNGKKSSLNCQKVQVMGTK